MNEWMFSNTYFDTESIAKCALFSLSLWKFSPPHSISLKTNILVLRLEYFRFLLRFSFRFSFFVFAFFRLEDFVSVALLFNWNQKVSWVGCSYSWPEILLNFSFFFLFWFLVSFDSLLTRRFFSVLAHQSNLNESNSQMKQIVWLL